MSSLGFEEGRRIEGNTVKDIRSPFILKRKK